MNRPRFPLLLASLFAFAGTVHAQVADGARTGDAWTDARLVDINRYGATYRDAFVDEVARYQRAPRELVEALLARPGWTPGDVYLACGLALQAGRPCRGVADAYDPSAGWDPVARELGIAPGSPQFRAFKRALVASYDRWARPLVLDAELAPDYPGRAHDAPEVPRGKRPATDGAGKSPAARRRATD